MMNEWSILFNRSRRRAHHCHNCCWLFVMISGRLGLVMLLLHRRVFSYRSAHYAARRRPYRISDVCLTALGLKSRGRYSLRLPSGSIRHIVCEFWTTSASDAASVHRPLCPSSYRRRHSISLSRRWTRPYFRSLTSLLCQSPCAVQLPGLS